MDDDDNERPQRDVFGVRAASEPDYSEYPPGLGEALRNWRELFHSWASDAYPRPEVFPVVEAALRAIDDAFSSAQLSADFDACPHCYTDADIAYLRTVPPAEMSDSDIHRIASSLTNTIGGPEDVAYFVPSIVRAQLAGTAIEDAIAMKRLGQIPAAHWTADRRDALCAAYEAYFTCVPEEEFGVYVTDPQYRAWIREMLLRPPHAEPFLKPIPGWDDLPLPGFEPS